MQLPPLPKDVFGEPLSLRCGDGTTLCHISTELCLRLACIHTGRLPTFLFSSESQYPTERCSPGYAVPIILPHIDFSTNLLTNQLLRLPEHLPPEVAIWTYPVVPREELKKLLRERILIFDEIDCISYLRLSSSWQNDIRQRCWNTDLISATWRVTTLLGRNLPDFYSHPLQTNLALNCKEVLSTTILPHARACSPPGYILDDTDSASLLCFGRLSFYSLLCYLPPLAICADHSFPPFARFYWFIQQISRVLNYRTGHLRDGSIVPTALVELSQKDPLWEEAAIFCISAIWPILDSSGRATIQIFLRGWIPKSSSQWNWDIRKAMIDEALWDKPSHIRNEWAVRASTSIVPFFLTLNKLDNAAYMLEYAFQGVGERLLTTPLSAELIRCLDDPGKEKATEFGERVLSRLSEYNSKLACEPLVRVALADVYMAAGNYTRAIELLKPILYTFNSSVHMKILVSLRLNKAKRRTEPEMDLETIGTSSSLKFVFLHLERVAHPLKMVCLSEIVATLSELKILNESEPTSWALLHLAWRRLDDDQSIRLDWRYKALQSLLKIPEPTALVVGEPLEKLDSDFFKEFDNWIEISQATGVTGMALTQRADFIPEAEVLAFFEDKKHGRFISGLVDLGDAFSRHINPRNGSSVWKMILTSPKTVCILLLLRRYDLLPEIASRLETIDSQLPYITRPEWIPSGEIEFWEKFYQTQWKFCTKPLNFDGKVVIMPPEAILPIKHLRYSGAGGCAVVNKATLHECYVENEFGVGTNSSTVCALKSFASRHAKQYYEAELRAFKHLARGVNKPESIIEFYGGIQIGNTFALLLEYADMGDLESYMREISPPTSELEMKRLWKRVLQLGDALAYQHQIPYRDKEEKIYGWHQDIKPSNILVTNGPDGVIFKLADFGLSHFRTIDSSVEDILDWDSFGTRIYGAPESFLADISDNEVEPKVGQGVDVWSLGCVYSEVAVWSTFGYPKLEYYRQSREEEAKDTPGLVYVGCFHNGHNALEAVASIHSTIMTVGDYNTPKQIIPLIDDMMSPKERRIPSDEVAAISAKVLDEGFAYRKWYSTARLGTLGKGLDEASTKNDALLPKKPSTQMTLDPAAGHSQKTEGLDWTRDTVLSYRLRISDLKSYLNSLFNADIQVHIHADGRAFYFVAPRKLTMDEKDYIYQNIRYEDEENDMW